MLIEGAQAELVGSLGQGLPHMFVMMNAARLQVGVQGVAIAERAFQQALNYATERKQGRTTWEADGAIYGHPDVRRTLMLMKAKIEAARGICLATGVLADLARLAETPEDRTAAKARQELLTPIAKAWSTDIGVEVASQGVQIHGGMGFMEQTGAAQHYRDARIAPIYEGTNAIQAIDLIGRKVRLNGGATMRALCEDMAATAHNLADDPDLARVGERLTTGVAALERATDWLIAADNAAALTAATPYLKLAGEVVGGWILGRQALAAAGSSDPWMQSKGALARLYAGQILTQASGQADAVVEADHDLERTAAAALAG
jgi:hypothetical protein